jgi:hypothetical protein
LIRLSIGVVLGFGFMALFWKIFRISEGQDFLNLFFRKLKVRSS